MTRPVKITLWSLAGIFLVFLASILIVVNVVFSKDKLTPIVRQQLPNFISCEAKLDNVELTFFSTFPKFCIQLNDFSLINPKEGALTDTLLNVSHLQAAVDVMKYIKNNEVHIYEVHLAEGDANLFMAADSTTNFDIFIAASEEDSSQSEFVLDVIDFNDIKLEQIHLSMVDQKAGRNIYVDGLNANVQGTTQLQNSNGDILLKTSAETIAYSDSIADVKLTNLQVSELQATITAPNIFNIVVSTAFDALECKLMGQESIELSTGAFQLSDLKINLADSLQGDGSLTLQLDTFHLSMTGKDPMELNLSKSTIRLPQLVLNGDLSSQFVAELQSTTFKTHSDGNLLNKMPITLSGNVGAYEDFSHIILQDGQLQVGKEKLQFNAEMANLDSITNQYSAAFSLSPTNFDRLLSLVPATYRKQLNKINIKGDLKNLEAKACVTLENGKPLELENFEIVTSINNLQYNEGKSMQAVAKQITFESQYPVENQKMSVEKRNQQIKRQRATNNKRRSKQVNEANFMQAKLSGDQLHFEMHDSMYVVADLPHADFNGTFSDEILQDSQSLPFIAADFSFSQLSAEADTISLRTHNLTGSFTMADGMRGMKKYYEASFQSKDADIKMGKSTSVVTGPLIIEASSVYDHDQKDLLLRYNPVLNVTLMDGDIHLAEVPYPFIIPSIDFDFNLGKFLIRDSQLKYGGSDFKLTGEVKNLREYLKKESDLLADLKLKSKQTDVYQLMDLVEQLAVPADSSVISSPSDAENYINATLQDHQSIEVSMSDANGADPFMVPQAIDLTLTTDIDKTIVGENEFNSLGGKLAIKDGNLILEEMGFSSKAARMQLTAIYRTPQKNNLFVGANFHLLDINIEDLIRMIPEIDTIVPMLRSFEGKGEFHFAAETNLFGNYDVKMSTLKATGSIEGKDLVLLDGETFSTISKYLMFNKQTRNRIDTLSVEMAVNRKKMTLYPMLIGMDKYQAVISGNHDLTANMPFNYHISVTDCPIVGGHIGLDITGDLEKPEDYSFKVVGCKYASLYKPEKRNITQTQALELKSLISDALKRTVKEQ